MINLKNILIVDSDIELIEDIKTYLADNEFNVDHTANSTVALNKIKENDYGLIIIEVILPESDGFILCKAIREIDSKANLPIILYSAEDNMETITYGFSCGCNDFMRKPIERIELKTRMLSLLKNHEIHKTLLNSNILLKDQLDKKNEEIKEKNKKLDEAFTKLFRMNRELSEEETSKNDIFKVISHEIKAPLNGIIGALSLLRMHDNEIINKQVHLLNNFVSKLENFSKKIIISNQLRTNTFKIKVETIQLKEIILFSINDNFEKAESKEVEILVSEIAPELQVIGDYELLKITFNAIIESAINHADLDTKISFTVTPTDDKIFCNISNSGQGFSEDELLKILQPTSKNDYALSENFDISLNFAKQIMDLHNGEIEISNNGDGGGATVKLIFTKEV